MEIHGHVEQCHVKNTGRCQELFLPGASIYIQEQLSSNRKTKYDLIAVEKGQTLINVDSQAPNAVVKEWLESEGLMKGSAQIKAEATYHNSRFDFLVQQEKRLAFLEAKGVTLEENGIALFPDAPTERGVKHIRELCDCISEGYEAYLIFVIQMQGCTCFKPNSSRYPEFGIALREAASRGVHIIARECKVQPNRMMLGREIPLHLD